ncbi:MAG: SPOR domain-containing protein [Saprospiraceae bacterium]
MLQIAGNEKDLSIYMADVDENGNFINEESLPFNGVDYSAGFACFGRDADEIYFSSNKGSDNFDIYYARKDSDGNWGSAVKLDANINTKGNEICPYFVSNKLYFSSDYLNGLGGYDIFNSVLYNDEWSFPINLGKGVNSPGDDLYYFQNENDSRSYFASNRLGAKGGLDIFYTSPLTREINKESDDIVYTQIPEAVNLKNLNEQNALNISSANIKSVSYGAEESEVVTLEGAKMVAYDDVILAPSNVYFIQLASLSKDRVNSSQYKSLTKYGNIYKINVNGYTKVRLGYFVSQDEADAVLSSVRSNGYRDAFIVEDLLNSSKLELLESSYTFTNTNKYVKPAEVGDYKIKLAAYTNPLYFDVNKVKDLGVIEQWSKGKWTIFILSGYVNYEDAEQALLKVRNRGFATAQLVTDDGGILTTVKSN